VVVESGAKLPEAQVNAPSLGTDLARDTCVVAQLTGEDDRSFRQRVARRLARLKNDGLTLASVQLVLGGDRGGDTLERRLVLAQTLLTALPTSDQGELVLSGELGRSSAGQLDVWALVETLTALPLGWATRVRALFDTPSEHAFLQIAA
jgi:hypothetical protein